MIRTAASLSYIDTNTMVVDDLEELVNEILGSLDEDALTFEKASFMYNSDFFAGESPLFRQKLCEALNNNWQGLHNPYWIKFGTPVVSAAPEAAPV